MEEWPSGFTEIWFKVEHLTERDIGKIAFLENLSWGSAYAFLLTTLLARVLKSMNRDAGNHVKLSRWYGIYRGLMTCLDHWGSLNRKQQLLIGEFPDSLKSKAIGDLKKVFE